MRTLDGDVCTMHSSVEVEDNKHKPVYSEVKEYYWICDKFINNGPKKQMS